MRTAMPVRTRRFVLALALAMVLVPAQAGRAGAQGVGISPVRLDYSGALRGGTYAESLLLSNSNRDGATEFSLSAVGEIASWVTFVAHGAEEAASSFVVPPSGRVQVGVTVHVPDDVANRDYSGKVQVLAKDVVAGDGKPAGADVGLGGFVDVVVRVGGDEHRAGRVIDTFVANAEVGMSQRFEARVQNTGNVSIQAQLDVRVLRGGDEVARLTTEGQNFPVLAQKDDRVFVEWQTTEQPAGAYTAEFVVRDLAGAEALELGSAVVPFRLEPRGTFTRSGSFDDLTVRNEPRPGGVAQVEAVFTNTGEIDVRSVFTGELYRDGELVTSVESLARTSRPGETVSIEVPIDLTDGGDYRLVGEVNFEGSVTAGREVSFDVGTARNESSRTATIFVIGSAFLVFLGAFQFIRNLRMRRSAKRAAAARLRAYDRDAARRKVREPANR